MKRMVAASAILLASCSGQAVKHGHAEVRQAVARLNKELPKGSCERWVAVNAFGQWKAEIDYSHCSMRDISESAEHVLDRGR